MALLKVVPGIFIGTDVKPSMIRAKGLANVVTWLESVILINNLQAVAKVYFIESGKTLTCL